MKFSFLFSIIIFLAFILRIYQISNVPPGLYPDEVSVGFNAYSLLKTGRDEHGVLLPFWFKAFGEYKLPVYIYLTAASELLLGKTDLSVRLPSILAGVGSVVVFIFLLLSLTQSTKLSLLGGLLLAISPWHLQFSRAAFEANMALFWVLLGTFFVIWGLKSNKSKFLLGILFFVGSLYTYNIERIFVPLFFVSLLLLFRSETKRMFSSSITWVVLLFFLLLTIPFWRFAVSSEGLIRAKSESFIQEVKITSDDFFRNLTFLKTHQYLKNYLSYFSFDFFFFSGDQIGRHSVREMGMTYLWQLPFFIIGLLTAGRIRKEAEKIFLVWLILAPIAGAFARPNPHALRGLLLVIPLAFFTSLGILQISFSFRKKLLMQIVLCGALSYFLLLYLHIYYVHYPKRTAADWHSGYKDLIEFVEHEKDKYQQILLTDRLVPDYIYFLFYGNMVLPEKYSFIKSPYVVKLEDKTLYVSPFWEKREERLLTTIYNLNGEELFKIWAN